MKLLYCSYCGDVVRLIGSNWRMCDCGSSGGQYNKDQMTATLGGVARVFGVANTFFNELFLFMCEEDRAKMRTAYKYGPGDCWWGEFKGDTQIFRIQDPKGSRLLMQVKPNGPHENGLVIIDKRPFTIDGHNSSEFKRGTVFKAPSNPMPSFKKRT